LRGRKYDAPFDPDESMSVDFRSMFWPPEAPDYAKQEAFVCDSDRMFQAFYGGRSTGKSWGLTAWVMKAALRNPGAPGGMLGRTGRDLRDKLQPALEDHMRRFKERTGISFATFDRASQEYLCFNGAIIQCRPYGRADTLRDCRGYSWAWIAADEIEHAHTNSKVIFDVLMFALRHERATWKGFGFATTPDGMRGLTAHVAKMVRAGSMNYYIKHATIYDNPHNDPEWIAALREGSSPRMWQQEGLGKILRPVEVVFDFDEARHVVPWQWDDSAPYIMAIDWGESHAYFAAIQIIGSTWIVAAEEKHEDTSRPKFRKAIERFVRATGRAPYAMFADRAVTSENAWLRGAFGPVCEGGILTCESRDEQRLKTGIAIAESMLNPTTACEACDSTGVEGGRATKKGIVSLLNAGPCAVCEGTGVTLKRPRLLFSSELDRGLQTSGRGLIGAMLNYRYRKTDEGVITSTPYKDDINDHPIDALRYALTMGAYDPALHGGGVLPYLLTHDLVLDEGEEQERRALRDFRAASRHTRRRTSSRRL